MNDRNFYFLEESGYTMASIKQKISIRDHEIHIGYGFLNNIANDVVRLLKDNTTVFIISDLSVRDLYGEQLKSAFQELQIPCSLITETQSNSNNIKEEIEQVSGYSYTVSLGSSSICKWSKILAAACKNSIGIAIIPTTLRGFVSNVNIEENQEPTDIEHYRTKSVFIDVLLLSTLPRRHFMSGMSEIIKVAVIHSSGWKKWTENISVELTEETLPNQNDFLDFVESNAQLLISASEDVIVEVVTSTLQIKSLILSLAKKNNNPEVLSVLTLGKCIGEAISEVIPELLYGECIAIGMVKEAEMCDEKILSVSTVGRLVRCLKRFDLPTRVPHHLKTHDVLAKLKSFPKNVSLESIQFVLEKQVSIVPRSKVSGTIKVPGSKSISNRVLLMAAIGHGTCHLSGILHSDDTQVMINALERIGTKFQWIDNDEVLVVHGTGGKFRITDSEQDIFVNHSGTSARFLTTFLTLVKGETDAPIHLTGSSRMKERPIGPLVDSLRSNGCRINYLEKDGCLPLAINYTGLKGGTLRMSAKISSTFVTSVLMSAPYASTPMIIELEEKKPTSLPYILMTIQLMARFNIHVKMQGVNRFIVPCGVYENPSHLEIEVDASSATYPLSMAAVTGGTVCVLGLGQHSLQGDAQFYTLLRDMGCTTVQCENFTTVTGPSNGILQAVSINMESMTDAFMTAVAVGATACGITQIRGISNQRVKESNRIDVMINELQKIGIPSGELEDGIWVEGIGNWSLESRKEKLKTSYISCHNDHRIAMSFAVLGCVLDKIIITDKECTEKTYPSFWQDGRNKLGLTIQPHLISYKEETIGNMNPSDNLPPCIFIIGMRGCGKSVLGLKASQTFQLKFIDMDILLEEHWQQPFSTYVKKFGLDKFRQAESQLLEKLLKNTTNGTIICCGGGVVESELSRMLLMNYAYVVYIERDLNSIISNLNQETNPRRVDLPEPIENTYYRRLPWYDDCSKLKFSINSVDKDIKHIHGEFEKFLKSVIPNMSRILN